MLELNELIEPWKGNKMARKIRKYVGAWALLSSLLVAGGDVAVAPVAPVESETSCLYVGGGVAARSLYADKIDWTSDAILGQDKVGDLLAIAGCRLHKYLAIEGRIGKSFFERDYSDSWYASVFLKPIYDVTEDFSVYGLLGYGYIHAEKYNGRVPAHPSEIGDTIVSTGSFQWGLGASYDINEKWTLFADYVWMLHDKSIPPQRLYWYDAPGKWNKLSIESINVGVLYHF
jgi:opacity protein-like surface antigen